MSKKPGDGKEVPPSPGEEEEEETVCGRMIVCSTFPMLQQSGFVVTNTV